MKKLTTLSHVFGNLLGLFAKIFAIVLMIALIGCTSSSTDDSDDNTPPQEQPSNPDGGDDGSGSGSSGNNEQVSLEELIANVESAQEVIDPLFEECETIDALAEYYDKIKAMECVSEVWIDEDILFIILKGGLRIGWSYHVFPEPDDDEYNINKDNYYIPSYNIPSPVDFTTRASGTEQRDEHTYLSDAKIGLVNINTIEKFANNMFDELSTKVSESNIQCTQHKGDITVNTLKSIVNQCNVIWFITHGIYERHGKHMQHWLMLEELSRFEESLSEELQEYYGYSFGTYGQNNPYDDKICYIKDHRTKLTQKYVSESFIKENLSANKESIIFCGACHALENNSNLANAFGANVFLGFNQTNCISPRTGYNFILGLLKGLTVGQAFENLSQSDKVENHPNDKDGAHYSELKHVFNNGGQDYCIVHPMVKTNANPKIEGTSATLEGVVEEWNGNKLLEGEVGFCWSKDNNDPKYNDSDKFAVKNIKASDEKEIKLSHTIKDLEPTTKYYYRAYLKINGEYQYGEVKSFETEEEPDDAYMRAYLIKLYNDTNGYNWRRNDNWCSDKPLDEWYGVDVYEEDGQFLYEIDLSLNKLQGTIDLSGCKSLQYLYCNQNELTSLNISGCTALKEVECSRNQLTNINGSGCIALEKLTCLINMLTSLDVSGCTALEMLHYSDDELISLNISECTALRSFSINGQLANLNASRCTALKYLDCSHNELTSLNVTGCTALTKLECQWNSLTSLDISGCSALQEVKCFKNQLSHLNVSGCISLNRLECYENQLTNLNVAGCTSLEQLECYDNQLTDLNASRCTALKYLYCNNNELTSLNVTGCTALIRLECQLNCLTNLNISEYSALQAVKCFKNQLSHLNVSGCTSLNRLECYDNQLTNLNISGCLALKELLCYDNQLTSLDVSGCSELRKLHCYNNKIIAEITKQLATLSYYDNFVYDFKYHYTYVVYGYYAEKWTDNGYGWYYPGEPSWRGHNPPEDWTK